MWNFRNPATIWRRAALPAAPMALLLVLALAGCGPSVPRTVKVSGKATYGGGGWPAAGRLTFPCVQPAEGFPSRPGFADLDTSGNFTASAYEGRLGLHPGKYVVHVECWEVPPSMDKPGAEKSYVSDDFHYEFEVRPTDHAVELNFDVPKHP